MSRKTHKKNPVHLQTLQFTCDVVISHTDIPVCFIWLPLVVINTNTQCLHGEKAMYRIWLRQVTNFADSKVKHLYTLTPFWAGIWRSIRNLFWQRERETDRQTDRETDRQKKRMKGNTSYHKNTNKAF